MGLRDISDFINAEYNAKRIGIASLMVIAGSSLFIGNQYHKVENKNYERNAIIQEALFKAQDKIIEQCKKREGLYKKMIIEQAGKEAIYRSIINEIINTMQDHKEKKQPTPAIKNLPEEI